MTNQAPLMERKRQRARARIVQAAGDLFFEHGFDQVSVADIAERAEVGRTTFFRYFGDKQEVVFADEQGLEATIAAARACVAEVPTTLATAIEQLRDVARGLCEQVTRDPVSYERHYELVDRHDNLRARDALKMQGLAMRLSEVLVGRGADDRTADLASQVAVACFQSARRRLGPDPFSLSQETDLAFEQVLRLCDHPDKN